MYLVSLHAAVLLSDSVFKVRNQTRQSLKQRRLKGYFKDLTLIGTKEANLAHLYPSSKTLLKVYYGSSVCSLSGVQHLWSFEYASTSVLVIFSIDDFAIEKNSFKLSDKNIPLIVSRIKENRIKHTRAVHTANLSMAFTTRNGRKGRISKQPKGR